MGTEIEIVKALLHYVHLDNKFWQEYGEDGISCAVVG